MAYSGFAVPPDNIVIFREGYQDRKRKKIRRKTLKMFSAGNQALQHKQPQLSLEAWGVCVCWGGVACKPVIVTECFEL